MYFEEREVEESHKIDPERKESVKCEVLTASFSGSILLNPLAPELFF